jgi:hypothetical protein
MLLDRMLRKSEERETFDHLLVIAYDHERKYKKD